jgi:exopolyphosphatase/guanosine-5'-triphosphate,3'-diphosphate pyrophosphatase
LRDGVLWDLLGRVHHRDIREVTVEQFARRYHVDPARCSASRRWCASSAPAWRRTSRPRRWTTFLLGARLHEIGISIAQGAYHKHSAYILANADMPGFSRQEQGGSRTSCSRSAASWRRCARPSRTTRAWRRRRCA